MRERLQEARAQNSNSNNSWMWNASRIAKPLRGGQNVPQDDFEIDMLIWHITVI